MKIYYKPIIKVNESKRNKDKILTPSEYLDMIRSYLSDIINDHKTQGEWKIHLGNTITEYKTQGEWKIHLTMAINFISSKDSYETRIMHAKSDNVEIMTIVKQIKLLKSVLNLFCKDITEGWKNQ